MQARIDFRQQATANFLFLWRQFQLVEPLLQTYDRQLYEVGNAATTDLDVFCLGLQSCAVTFVTRRLSTITRQHDTILNLILILLQHLEEIIDGYAVVLVAGLIAGQSVPKHILLLLRQVIVRFEDGKIVLGSTTAEFFLPHLHLIAVPRLHTTVVDRQCGIGNDEVFVDADNLAETLTLRAGTSRRIEGEHLVVGLLERHAVSLETLGEVVGQTRGGNH